MLIGSLRGEQELQLPARRGHQEGRKEAGDVELGVEAVREDPHESFAIGLGERLEGGCIRRQVDRERRPLMPLPVLVERGVRRCP